MHDETWWACAEPPRTIRIRRSNVRGRGRGRGGISCSGAVDVGRERRGAAAATFKQARLLRQKTENRYLAVLVAARGVNRCRKALFGASSRPDTPSAVLGGETVEH